MQAKEQHALVHAAQTAQLGSTTRLPEAKLVVRKVQQRREKVVVAGNLVDRPLGTRVCKGMCMCAKHVCTFDELVQAKDGHAVAPLAQCSSCRRQRKTCESWPHVFGTMLTDVVPSA